MTKQRREMESAIASAKLAGFEFTQEELNEFEKVINGELTTDDLRQNFLEKIEQLKITNPEKFWNPNLEKN